MQVRIIFKSKYACEKDWSDGKCNQALYEKDKSALLDWKKLHKIICYLIPLVETALVLTAIWFFIFHALPSIFHRYYDAGDFDTGFRSSLLAGICFLGILPFAVKLQGMLLRKLNLKGPAVPEPPRWRDLELKYERYTLIQPLLTSDENTPIAIAAAASFGFRSVRNQDTSADPNCIILDFDRELILIPAATALELDGPEHGEQLHRC